MQTKVTQTLEERIEYARSHPERPDFGINPKQTELYNVVMMAAAGRSPHKFVAIGGGFRGGKTYCALALFVLLCAVYPKSRWIVIADTHTFLTRNTWPELLKIISGSDRWVLNMSRLIATYANGSTIEFIGEDHDRYPQCQNLDGLFCSGILIDEGHRCSRALFNKCVERMGSLRATGGSREPKGFVLCSFNFPCHNWLNDLFVKPWRAGSLKPDYHFILSLPTDNPTNSAEQFEQWAAGMTTRDYRAKVEGDNTDHAGDNLFAWAFDREAHVQREPLGPEWAGDRRYPLYLSFDFNYNPMACSVIQHYDGTIRVLETIKLPNSDVQTVCQRVLAAYPDYQYVVTGDYNGNARSATLQDEGTAYTIIKGLLRVSSRQIKVFTNPRHKDNQVLMNMLLQKYRILLHPTRCSGMLFDLENVRMGENRSIIKAERGDETQQADCLDTLRYFCNAFMTSFAKYGNERTYA